MKYIGLIMILIGTLFIMRVSDNIYVQIIFAFLACFSAFIIIYEVLTHKMNGTKKKSERTS